MKNFNIVILLIIAGITISSSCNKQDSQTNTCLQGKIIQKWCNPSNLAIIQILSNERLGEDWSRTLSGTKYTNTILAQIDSTSFKTASTYKDSIFYFTYDLKISKANGSCYVCCPPSKFISITNIFPNQCSTNK